MGHRDRNLNVLVLAQVVAISAMGIVIPLIPFFVRELGISDRAPKVSAVSAGKVPIQKADITVSAISTSPVPAATKTNKYSQPHGNHVVNSPAR